MKCELYSQLCPSAATQPSGHQQGMLALAQAPRSITKALPLQRPEPARWREVGEVRLGREAHTQYGRLPEFALICPSTTLTMTRRRGHVSAAALAASSCAAHSCDVRLPSSQYSVTKQGGEATMPMMDTQLGCLGAGPGRGSDNRDQRRDLCKLSAGS